MHRTMGHAYTRIINDFPIAERLYNGAFAILRVVIVLDVVSNQELALALCTE